MKILHTSYWHLGSKLFEYSKDEEMELFFKWFIELLKNGGKGVRVPNKKVGFTKISFNKSNYHLGGEINTYLKSDVYQAIMSYVDNNK